LDAPTPADGPQAGAAEGKPLSEAVASLGRRGVGIRDIPKVFVAPRSLFARVEDIPSWNWPLLILLTVVTLIGYAKVETGLIDREVDLTVRARIAQIDQAQRDVVQRSQLRELYDQEYKMGEFWKLLKRIQVIFAEPAQALATALLVAAVLYGMVALSGRKPEWNTLLTICVFAGFVDAMRLLTALGLMLRHATLNVDTSAALLVRWMIPEGGLDAESITTYAGLHGLLTGVDAFRIWYWLVVLIGLSVTRQLPRWRAWLTCGLCWLIGAGVRAGLTVAAVANATGQTT
jgi:hypothetical protein